jgi:hypothetical protein
MVSDGIRLLIEDPEVIERFIENENLDFQQKYSIKTGEVHEGRLEARYKRLWFSCLQKGLWIRGNFPKYYNDLNNIGPANIAHNSAAVQAFCKEFRCRAEDVKIIRLEVGHNVVTEQCPKYIMDNIITYRNKRKEADVFPYKGYLIKFSMGDYDLVFYDKGTKHDLMYNLLRMELVLRSKKLRYFGIHTLADLQNSAKMRKLFMHLIKCVNECVFDDRKIDAAHLPHRTAVFLNKYRDNVSWVERHAANPDYCRKLRAKFRRIIKENCINDWQAFLHEELEKVLQTTTDLE